MTYLESAAAVLAAGRVMTAQEITHEAMDRGLVRPTTKTPVATMSAALYVDVLRNPATRFVRLHEPGENRAKRSSVRWALRES